MMKRKCPECGATWYSANSEAKFWRCDDCGAKINIDRQEPANAPPSGFPRAQERKK